MPPVKQIRMDIAIHFVTKIDLLYIDLLLLPYILHQGEDLTTGKQFSEETQILLSKIQIPREKSYEPSSFEAKVCLEQ